MSTGICGKRAGSDDVFGSPPSVKRSRRSPCGSPIRCSDAGSVPDHKISTLLRMFPSVDPKVVESVLDSNFQKIDDAVQALNALCAGNDNQNVTEDGMSTQISKENAEGFQNECLEESKLLQNGSSLVDLFVQEMMNASGWDDVRARTTKFLEAFERSILVHTATSKELEIALLKEQLQCLLKDNYILKRGFAIQHERNVEQEERLKEVSHLKQIVTQCHEQIRKLEMDNYALRIRLQRSEQPGSILSRYNPDIF